MLIELARLVLQWWSYKKYEAERDKTYCTSYECENIAIFTKEDRVQDRLNSFGKNGYEIASVSYLGFNKDFGCRCYSLFFTKKKIKKFSE